MKKKVARICPIGDQLALEPIKPKDKTPGGLVLPEVAQEQSNRGVIVAVGPKVEATLTLEPGRVVIYQEDEAHEIKVDGAKYVICREKDILCAVD